MFVPVTSDGIDVFRSMETDVIVDLWGWFTGPSAASSTDGMFVPQSPSRVWDSRSSLDPLHAGGTVEKVATPPGAAAVVVNLTSVESTRPGSCRSTPPAPHHRTCPRSTIDGGSPSLP